MTARVWTLGVVMRDGVPTAEVREGQVDDGPDFRVMQWQVMGGRLWRLSGCSRKAPCNLENACANHQRDAPWWWFEWKRRDDRRKRRDKLAFTAIRGNTTYTFRPNLPDTESEFWGCVNTHRDGEWMATAAKTLQQAQDLYRDLTGEDMPRPEAGPLFGAAQ